MRTASKPCRLVPAAPAPHGQEGDLDEADGRYFIQGKVEQLPQDYSNLSFFLAKYDIEQYRQGLFDAYAIDMPADVCRSVRKRQAEFLAGRLCARSILEVHGHIGHTVGTGMYREPQWPRGIIGSITHSSYYAAAAACPDTHVMGVGIDIESIISQDQLHDIITLILCADELAYLRSLGHEMDIARLLTLSFSAKECFFKAAFAKVKDYFGFEAVEIVFVDLKRRRLRMRCTRSLSRELKKGSMHEAYFDFLDNATLFTAVVLKTESM